LKKETRHVNEKPHQNVKPEISAAIGEDLPIRLKLNTPIGEVFWHMNVESALLTIKKLETAIIAVRLQEPK
jgi:hypothetical protein